jgi:Flp pilus assembly protein TadG
MAMVYRAFDRQAWGARGGVMAVEAALTLPVVVFLLFGVVEVGSLVGDIVVLNAGARAGVRTAIIGATTADIAARVASVTTSLEQAKLAITSEYRVRVGGVWGAWTALGDVLQGGITVNTAPSGAELRVTLAYRHDLLLPGLFRALANTPQGDARLLQVRAYMQRE